METKPKESFHPDNLAYDELKKIALAFDQMDALVGVTDLQGNLIYANRSALKNVNATPNEIKGIHLRESLWRNHSTHSQELTDEMIAKALKGERAIAEDSMVNSRGELIPVIFSITPLFDDHGKVVALVPEGKIISDLKFLQAKLEKERWQTQQWIDSLDANVAMCTPEGKIISCNLPFLNLLRTAPEVVKGQRIDELSRFPLADSDNHLIRSCILKASKGKKCTLEAKVTLPGKGEVPFVINISPIFGPEGDIKYLALEAKDISEQVKLRELTLQKEKEYSTRLRKEVENATRALRETEQFNKNVVDSAPMGIMHLNQQGEVVFANPEIERKLSSAGFPNNLIKGKQLSELSLFPADDSWEKVRRLHFGKGRQFRHKRLILRPGKKEPLLFEVNTAPLRDLSGKAKGTIVIMNDVTERTRLEFELVQTHMQSEKLASLGQLISGVAHEINNPLTSVIGCSEYLLKDCDLKNQAFEAAEIIRTEARRSGSIVKNLLAFARQSVTKKEAADLNEIIMSVLQIRMYGLKDRKIKVILHLDDDIPLVCMDANQIQQVILNLINNAVDAIDEVATEDRHIIISTQFKNSLVAIDIEDNGPGIPETLKSKMFDPFFTTKEPGKGTGLGLSISYGIIQAHGGEIFFRSVYPCGSCFTIQLPASDSSAPIAHKAKGLEWEPQRVLVVDDEKNICVTVSNHLNQFGTQVDMAANGLEASEKVREKAYDILLVDIKMPKMNGMAFYEAIVEERPELARRFVLMTGAQGKDVERFILESSVPILPKPFGREDLLQILNFLGKPRESKLSGEDKDENTDH